MATATTTATTAANAAPAKGKSLPSGPVVTASGALSKKRLTRPSKDQFNASLLDLEAELRDAEKELEVARNGVKSSTPQGREELTKELGDIKTRQATLKTTKGKVLDQIQAAEEGVRKKIKELQAMKSKTSFKSVDELDAKIASLEKAVDAGTMRLVEEKKCLGDISSLKKVRKNFGQVQDLQAAVDADKAKVAQLKSQLDDKESKRLNNRFDEIKAELNSMRDSQQKSYNRRKEAVERRDKIRGKIQALKDEYYSGVRAYQEQVKAEQAARIEAEKAQKVAQEKEKKKADAEAKLAAASEPAFLVQREVAENLLAHFDPEYKRSEENELSSVNGKSVNTVRVARKVEDVQGGTLLQKTEEVLFAGESGKKNKKSNKKSDDKLKLNVGIIDDLSLLNIDIPTSKSEIPETVQKIKDKLQFYKENEERVTKERVERAKAEIAKLEEDGDKENAKTEENNKQEKADKQEDN